MIFIIDNKYYNFSYKMSYRKIIKHLRSSSLENNKAKLPLPNQIGIGEIAINYRKDNEKLIIKNDNEEIVTFQSDKVTTNSINILASAITKLSNECGFNESIEYQPQNDLLINSNSLSESVEILAENLSAVGDISNLATKEELTNGLDTKQDKGDYLLKSEYFQIKYIGGYSDKDGYITNEIAPTNALIISRMYLHPTLNMWCHCPSYETATNGDKIITGGIKYGVAVVVGGTEAQTFPNCKYRTYYIETNNI